MHFHGYVCWARRPDVKSRPGRRPSSQSVFERLFGGFPAALLAAEIVRQPSQGVHGAWRDRGRVTYRYEEADFEAAMLEVIRRGRVTDLPSIGVYDRIRQQILEEAEEAEKPFRGFPGGRAIGVHYGGWAKARERARELLRADRSSEDGSS